MKNATSTYFTVFFGDNEQAESDFELLMEIICECYADIGDYFEDELEEQLEELPQNIQKATKAIVSNKWFWRFDPEIAQGAVDEESDESALLVEFMLEKESDEVAKIVEWMKACRAEKVKLSEGDMTEDDYYASL